MSGNKKSITEAEAKAAYENAKKAHEAALEKFRLDQLEYVLASEDNDRANRRYRTADTARNSSAETARLRDLEARDAFIAFGKAQIAMQGNVK
jgi:hypothetical protein